MNHASRVLETKVMKVHAGLGLEERITVYFASRVYGPYLVNAVGFYNANPSSIDDPRSLVHRKHARVVSVSGIAGLGISVQYAARGKPVCETIKYELERSIDVLSGLTDRPVMDAAQLLDMTVFAYFHDRKLIGLSRVPLKELILRSSDIMHAEERAFPYS